MAKGPGTPPPECCGEPKLWHAPRAGTPYDGWWDCRVVNRERCRQRYEKLNGREYNRLLLDHRRDKALARRRTRKVA
jgi:hypothetical protein